MRVGEAIDGARNLTASQHVHGLSIDLRPSPLVRQAPPTRPICLRSNVSVGMHYSIVPKVVTQTLTMAISGGRTPILRVVSSSFFPTLHPIAFGREMHGYNRRIPERGSPKLGREYATE